MREGLMLYWCEGDKPSGNSHSVAVTSGDFLIIKLFLGWIEKYFEVSRSRLRLRLHLWPDSNEMKAKEYWSKNLDMPLESFTKSYIKPKSGVKRRYEHGICRLGFYSKKILTDILNEIEKEFY